VHREQSGSGAHEKVKSSKGKVESGSRKQRS
jgi:hypothetical protein